MQNNNRMCGEHILCQVDPEQYPEQPRNIMILGEPLIVDPDIRVDSSIREWWKRKVNKMEYILLPKSEINERIKVFQSQMDDMDGALLFQSMDVCYFSGTAQDGLVYVLREGEPVVMIRRSLDRAKQESPLEVKPLKNMRKLKSDLGIPSGATIGP